MTRSEPAAADTTRRIVVRPNCSLSRREALLFFAAVSAVCLTIAAVFAFLGLWPVLPFAGLELAVLGAALALSLQRGRYREIISVSTDQLVVERGVGDAGERDEFARHWASVHLCLPRSAWHPSRLIIQAGSHACEIGNCLTESERRGLGMRLAELVGPVGLSPALSPPGQPT